MNAPPSIDLCTQSHSNLLHVPPETASTDSTSVLRGIPISRKQKRAEAAKRDKQIDDVLLRVGEQVDKQLQDAAIQLNIEAQVLTSRFLAARSAFHESKPTAWQGFVSKMSAEWKDEADGGRKYKGAAYLNYVVKRISEEGLYTSLSQEQKDELVVYAQELRDSKISAGSARTADKRLVQGNVRNELYAMAERLQHLHEVTNLEAMLVVVRGKSTDGLKPAYFVSNNARQFLESHISVKIDQFIKLLEISCTSGAVGVAEENEMTRDKLKRLVRDSLRESLCTAALSTASDGSGPTIQDADEISAISWTNYKTLVLRYKVVVFGWPMTADGAMVDPSSIGGKRLLESYLNRITDKLNPTVGFKRLTHDEWAHWCEENNVSTEGLGRMRKVRSDKGKSRKGIESGPIICDAPTSNKRKSRDTASNASKPTKRPKKTGNGSSPNIQPASEPATEGMNQFEPLPAENTSNLSSTADSAIVLPLLTDQTTIPSFSSDLPIDSMHFDAQVDFPSISPSFSQHFAPSTPLLANSATFGSTPGAPVGSPTYPLNRVPVTQPQQSGSFNIPPVPSSTASPRTPRATRTRRRKEKDPFIVMSPETYASRTPRTRRARTGSLASQASRPSSPPPTSISPNIAHGSQTPFSHITHPFLLPGPGSSNLAHLSQTANYSQFDSTSTNLAQPSAITSFYTNTEFASPSE